MTNRWWVYQRERFPVIAHGPIIAAFSFSAVCYSSLLRGAVQLPPWTAVVTAFGTAFLFFLQLRIADEFKDFEEDSRYRPYRPVPRGLVTLRELGIVWAVTGLAQLALGAWLKPSLILLLAGVWFYLAMMSKEFFVGEWLRNHPLVYLFSHMIILPLVDFYATACDWWPVWGRPPEGLIWFLLVSYCNGVVIEIGRKIRAPEDEETGVNTYSFLWGRKNAIFAWLAALGMTALFAAIAAGRIGFLPPVACLLGTLLVIAIWMAARFLSEPISRHGHRIETISGVWTLLVYLSLGAVPLLWMIWRASSQAKT